MYLLRIAVCLFVLLVPSLANAQDVGQSERPPSKAREHYESGNSYLEQGKYALASDEYKQAIRIQPWLADAHLMLGLASYCRGQFALAAIELRNGIRLTFPGEPKYSWPFATVQLLSLQRAGRSDEAGQLLAEWSNVGGHLERDVKYLSGKWTEVKYLKKRKKESAHGYLVIGVNSLVQGDLEKGKRTLQSVAKEPIDEDFQWTHRIAEAELERIERCGVNPCAPQDSREGWMFKVEQGRPEELRDVQTVYLTPESDRRENILGILEKYDGIRVLHAVEDKNVDVILVFDRETESHPSQYGPGLYATVTHIYGAGLAFTFRDEETIRVFWRFYDAHWLWKKYPSTNFARDFIKLIKKLRK